MAKKDLNAQNRSWSNELTGYLAEMLDETGYEERVDSIISDFERDGLMPQQIREGVWEMIYADLIDAYNELAMKADSLESVLIVHPSETDIAFGQIADAYLELFCTGSRNAKAKTSRNVRPKAPARKTTAKKTAKRPTAKKTSGRR